MTFLAPGFLFASLAAAAGVIALHFIVTRQPRAGILPTARFVPDLPATATARATRPSDLLLLLLRVLLVLAAGAGLAQPVFKPPRGPQARVILMDASRSVIDSVALQDSVRASYRDGDVVIAFDSSARILDGSIADSIAVVRRTDSRGNLSAAMIAAMRAASSLRERADSIELVVVSPLAREEIDAATAAIRRQWPGRARIVIAGRTAQAAGPIIPGALEVESSASDPMAISAGLASTSANARVIRDASIPETQGETVVIEWPVATQPRRTVPRAKPDTIGGVVAGDAVVVSGFERRWKYSEDSIRGAVVIARWIDGEPAAIEFKSGATCERSVAIPVSPIGDLAIRQDFIRLVSVLSDRCLSQRDFIPAGAGEVGMLTGAGSLAPRDAFRARSDIHSWLAPWLLGVAFLAAIAELFVRRAKSRQLAGSNERASRMRSAA